MASARGLWLWLLLLSLLRGLVVLVSGDDAAALLQFKAAVGDPTGFLAGWQQGKAVCGGGWAGVTCGGGDHVIALDLSGRNMSGGLPLAVGELWGLRSLNLGGNLLEGELPAAALANLSFLEYLNITFNNFSGEFPVGLGKLQRLEVVDAYSNAFTGPLPEELPLLEALDSLHLGGSFFQGQIPAGYGGFKRLRYLHLGGNELTGPLPPELGRAVTLEHLELQYNAFEGGIPPEWGNLSSLVYLDIGHAGLSGPITGEVGRMEKLDSLFLVGNALSGPLPKEFGKLASLRSLDLSENAISGELPAEMAGMVNLTYLNLLLNGLDGEFPAWIGELPDLVTVYLWGNSLKGELPPDWGMNAAVERVDVSENQLVGPIPPGLCDGGALVSLIMFGNNLNGSIPQGLARCPTLQRVRLQDNLLSGQIPPGFGSMPELQRLELSNNSLSGAIPEDLLQSSNITFIDLSTNRLNGSLPRSEAAWTACHTLQELHIAQNFLSGSIPAQIGGCTLVTRLDFSENNLTGAIPAELGLCLRLVALNLSKNQFGGEIPASLSTLQQLAILDVSANNLSGSIPPTLGSATSLDSVNVSFNALTGAVPRIGIFQYLNASYFMGNPGLCGGAANSGLPPCTVMVQPMLPPAAGGGGGGGNRQHKKVVWLVAAIFGVTAVVLLVGVLCFLRQYRWYMCGSTFNLGSFRQEFDHLKSEAWPWKLTAFQKVGFTAAEIVDCLKEVNVVGKGGAGTVYRGEMQSGEVVAVKKLLGSRKSLSPLEDHGFSAEVDLLGNIRHRNIVRLLAYCSNNDTELLVYEYMPNGSLGEVLHGDSSASGSSSSTDLLADWVTRYRIAVGVAQGLCYLHHDSNPQIVHRDIKASNILLDSEMEACVADFGVAKLFVQSDRKETMSVIAGSYGYIAPEYAYTMKVDEKSDIYSFGVVLLELLTGRRPAEPEFGDSRDIVQWVTGKLRNRGGLAEVLDPNLGASGSSVQEEMLLVLRIALRCTSKYPDDRPSMRDVVIMLAEAEPRRKGSFKNPLWSTPHRSPLR